MNENYAHPAMPAGAAQGILSGMYLLQIGGRGKVRVTLFGSGTILREVLAAAELLEKNYGVPADVYSVTSFSELRKNALAVERWNMLHPAEPRKKTYIEQVLAEREGPFIAATDYMKTVADQIRQWVPGPLPRSEPTASAAAIRARNCAVSLKSTATTWRSLRSRPWRTRARSTRNTVTKAMQTFGIDPEKSNPVSV